MVKSVCKEGVNCMEFGKLFLEDEHVVHVVEDPVEIGRKKERFDLFDHMFVRCIVNLLNMFQLNRRKLSFLNWLLLKNIFYLLDMHQ